MEAIKLLDEYAQALGCEIRKDVPMRDYTTFKIGGACERLVEPSSVEQISGVLAFCREHGIPLTLVGNGSNLLVSDTGIPGCVLHLGNLFSNITLEENNIVCCEAGASLAKTCVFAQKFALSGLEFAYGIPGSVGGAAYMNAGAYGGEVKDVILSCEHVDESGKQNRFTANELQFSYRHSIYSEKPYCITRIRFRLTLGNREEIRNKMEDFMGRRRAKQPLEYPSAGSTFKRPEGAYASALIDQCGLKGFSVGGARVSEKHAGFVINAGGATYADVRELICRVTGVVKEKTGFVLEPEVKIIP